jgi:hypothetical protein
MMHPMAQVIATTATKSAANLSMFMSLEPFGGVPLFFFKCRLEEENPQLDSL